jgi:hypothetical protein
MNIVDFETRLKKLETIVNPMAILVSHLYSKTRRNQLIFNSLMFIWLLALSFWIK